MPSGAKMKSGQRDSRLLFPVNDGSLTRLRLSRRPATVKNRARRSSLGQSMGQSTNQKAWRRVHRRL